MFKNIINSTQEAIHQESDLRSFKNKEEKPFLTRIIDILNLYLVLFGIPLVVFGIFESIEYKRPYLAVQYALLFSPVILTFLFKKILHYRVRALIILLSLYAIAITNIYAYGFSGAGIPIFLLYFTLAALFFNLRGGVIALASAIPPAALIGLMIVRGDLEIAVKLYEINRMPISWLTALALIIALGAIVIISIHIMKNGLEESLLKNSIQNQSLQAANSELEKLLLDKNDLLHELHHRVKNNLSIIKSLLYLKSNSIASQEDAVQAFKETQSLVSSIALIHKKIYQVNNFSQINMKSYIEPLVKDILALFSHQYRPEMIVDIEDIYLSVKVVLPCAIIINEAVTNSLKHSFTNKNGGIITVAMRKDDEEITLTISDNGIGINVDRPISQYRSLGLQIIDMHVQQLGGSLSIEKKDGTLITVRFRHHGLIADTKKELTD